MWIDQADGLAEIFKGYLPYYLLVALPIFIIMSPVNPVAASHEFSVYRMQQYDLHTVPHGCRSASFNLEGRSLTSWSTARHCVVARLQDITIEQFINIRNKAGALLLVMPANVTMLTPEEKEHIQLLEMAMVAQEISAPVYFAKWSPEFEDILKDLQHSMVTDDRSGTALEAMMNTVSSNGYQIVVSAPTPQKMESKAVTIQGKLGGRSASAQTVIIAAHYDAAAAVPELSFGADSNASGAAALLELARIFSRLYSMAGVRAGPTLVFVLASTGHGLNYFSYKKWLEEHLDSTDASLLQDVSFALCLDAISGPSLTLHVSRPPTSGAPLHRLAAHLGGGQGGGATIQHKKINLAAELLAWPHERFGIRRVAAATVSSIQSHKDPSRGSILDTPTATHEEQLVTNTQHIARALAHHLYNLTLDDQQGDRLYEDALEVEAGMVRHWYRYLSSQPRAAHTVTAAPHASGVSAALERALSRYMEVSVHTHTPDKREPEYTLYTPTRAQLNVYSVKPAVFDLVLTLCIAAYLCVVWGALQVFPRAYTHYANILNGNGNGRLKVQ